VKKKGIISAFRGDYRWLSNFERCNILYKDILYKSVESAFQAQKTKNIKARYIFTKLDARESKTLGGIVQLREDWETIKDSIMLDICKIKFNLPQFKSKLVDTGEMEIVEGNYWGDTYWGVCDGEGDNKLGKIIMEVRQEIKEDLKRID
jgi:ribA/ribD-fused uncharacterized protein